MFSGNNTRTFLRKFLEHLKRYYVDTLSFTYKNENPLPYLI